MLRAFWLSWLLYWGLLLVLPLQLIYPHAIEAFAIQLGFVTLVSLGYGLVLLAFNAGSMPKASERRIPYAKAIAIWTLLFSVIGAAFLFYDKSIVQGIDYSEGLAAARQQWNHLGEERTGVSSVFSVLGYALGSGYYVALIIAVMQPHIGRFTRVGIFLLSVGAALFNSYLSGGRSALLLLVAVALSASCSRRGSSLLRMFPSTIERLGLLSVGAIVAGYALFIFYSRATLTGVDAVNYTANFLPFLGFEWEEVGNDGIFDTVAALALLAAAYLVHSFATVAAMVADPDGGNVMLFGHAANLLSKLGFSISPGDEGFLSGRFPSLPGAIWYNYGTIGLVFGSIFLGLAAAAIRVWTSRRPYSLLAVGAFSLIGSILILSPLLFAGDFYFFPFAAFSLVMFSFYPNLIRLMHFMLGGTSLQRAN